MNNNFHTNSGKLEIPKFAKESITTLLMKNVHHHNLIEKFIELEPSIKIIGLIRHPCAVISSQLNCIKEISFNLNDYAL